MSYKELLQDVAGCELKSKFKDFKVEDDRVDVLLYECVGKNKKFEKSWGVVREVLLVSHGQASAERGFSLNRQIEKDNLGEGMLVGNMFISWTGCYWEWLPPASFSYGHPPPINMDELESSFLLLKWGMVDHG